MSKGDKPAEQSTKLEFSSNSVGHDEFLSKLGKIANNSHDLRQALRLKQTGTIVQGRANGQIFDYADGQAMLTSHDTLHAVTKNIEQNLNGKNVSKESVEKLQKLNEQTQKAFSRLGVSFEVNVMSGLHQKSAEENMKKDSQYPEIIATYKKAIESYSSLYKEMEKEIQGQNKVTNRARTTAMIRSVSKAALPKMPKRARSADIIEKKFSNQTQTVTTPRPRSAAIISGFKEEGKTFLSGKPKVIKNLEKDTALVQPASKKYLQENVKSKSEALLRPRSGAKNPPAVTKSQSDSKLNPKPTIRAAIPTAKSSPMMGMKNFKDIQEVLHKGEVAQAKRGKGEQKISGPTDTPINRSRVSPSKNHEIKH